MKATEILLVDASVFITLAEIGHVESLGGLDGDVHIPEAVIEEISDDPAKSKLDGIIKRKSSAADEGWLNSIDASSHPSPSESADVLQEAADHLGEGYPETELTGDVALLALGLFYDRDEIFDTVVITDDKPLRKTCKALGVPISGSTGVIIAAVERGDLDPGEAKDALVGMDAVGAHLSASLLRRAKRLIDEAARG